MQMGGGAAGAVGGGAVGVVIGAGVGVVGGPAGLGVGAAVGGVIGAVVGGIRVPGPAKIFLSKELQTIVKAKHKLWMKQQQTEKNKCRLL